MKTEEKTLQPELIVKMTMANLNEGKSGFLVIQELVGKGINIEVAKAYFRLCRKKREATAKFIEESIVFCLLIISVVGLILLVG